MTASVSPAWSSCPSVKLTDCSLPSTWLWMATVFDAATVPRLCRKIGTSRRATDAAVTGTAGDGAAVWGGCSNRRHDANPPARTTRAMTARQQGRCPGRLLVLSAIAFIGAPVVATQALSLAAVLS